MNGFLLIDKPAGITSHDVVDRVRSVAGTRRVGHAGTLDPFATGLLIVGVGAATKGLADFSGLDKEYDGVAVLGATSDTQDGTGKMTPMAGAVLPDETAVRTVMAKFVGDYDQTPPMYSAKKVGGKKLYELARAGVEIERKPVRVVIRRLELREYDPPRLSFRVICSSGTYVRTLAHDIGIALDVGAYLETLRRTAIGPRRVEEAIALAALTKENWRDGLLTYEKRPD